ncbi:MAG: hypothetical protein AAFP68_10085 [Pseudomonadota bacterium]
MRKILKAIALTMTFAGVAAGSAGSGASGQFETGVSTAPEPFVIAVGEMSGTVRVDATRSALDRADVSLSMPGGPSVGPVSLNLALWDGEELSFALPGAFETRYRVIRIGNRIEVASEQVVFLDSAIVD